MQRDFLRVLPGLLMDAVDWARLRERGEHGALFFRVDRVVAMGCW